jgi:putative membrane protein
VTPSSGSATTVSGNGLAQGANSFTKGQARTRLEHNGYSQVSRLTKDNDGIWRGTATKHGSTVHVGVDFKGDMAIN